MCVLAGKEGIQDSDSSSVTLKHCTVLGGIPFGNERCFIIPRKKSFRPDAEIIGILEG